MDKAPYFSEVRLTNQLSLAEIQTGKKTIQDRNILKEFLEYIHIKKGLLKAYNADYPLIDVRELLPSFENIIFFPVLVWLFLTEPWSIRRRFFNLICCTV
jgi:hypothetical protein